MNKGVLVSGSIRKKEDYCFWAWLPVGGFNDRWRGYRSVEAISQKLVFVISIITVPPAEVIRCKRPKNDIRVVRFRCQGAERETTHHNRPHINELRDTINQNWNTWTKDFNFPPQPFFMTPSSVVVLAIIDINGASKMPIQAHDEFKHSDTLIHLQSVSSFNQLLLSHAIKFRRSFSSLLRRSPLPRGHKAISLDTICSACGGKWQVVNQFCREQESHLQ